MGPILRPGTAGLGASKALSSQLSAFSLQPRAFHNFERISESPGSGLNCGLYKLTYPTGGIHHEYTATGRTMLTAHLVMCYAHHPGRDVRCLPQWAPVGRSGPLAGGDPRASVGAVGARHRPALLATCPALSQSGGATAGVYRPLRLPHLPSGRRPGARGRGKGWRSTTRAELMPGGKRCPTVTAEPCPHVLTSSGDE